MRLTQKIAKLADPRTIESARRHLYRFFLTRRFSSGIKADDVIASIDRKKFQEIKTRHASENPGIDWPKYLDLKLWMEINLRRVRDLELDFGRRRDILDLGSGAGYFLYICKWLGHRPVGLDIDEVPMYPEMTSMLGLERVVWRVEAFKPLPNLGRKFDLITAFMICFNNHQRPDVWGVREWEFLLDDLSRHLKPHGRIWLELNIYQNESDMTEELRAMFERRGASVIERRVSFRHPPKPGR